MMYTKSFYSTKSVRSLSQVRKLFDCYKSIRKETNEESEGLRQRQEHGGANTGSHVKLSTQESLSDFESEEIEVENNKNSVDISMNFTDQEYKKKLEINCMVKLTKMKNVIYELRLMWERNRSI